MAGPRKSSGTAKRTQPSAPVRWRNRIVRYGEESPDQLLANPFNFRVHTRSQEKAMKGVLDEVGVIQNVIVNVTTGHMIDGHLRTAMAISEGQPKVPITYVELTEEEEKLALATFDPLSAMAGSDDDILNSLKAGMSEDHLGLMAATSDELMPAGESGAGGESNGGFGLEFKVVVDCLSEMHQTELLDRFKNEGMKCRALIS